MDRMDGMDEMDGTDSAEATKWIHGRAGRKLQCGVPGERIGGGSKVGRVQEGGREDREVRKEVEGS